MLGGDGEVLAHGQVVEQLDRLPRPGQTAPGTDVWRQAGDVGAVQLDRAAMLHESGDGVDERGLAGAVRADQTDQLAGLDVEIDTDHGVHAAERDRDAAGGQHRAHGSVTIAVGPPAASAGPGVRFPLAAAAARLRRAAACGTSFPATPSGF